MPRQSSTSQHRYLCLLRRRQHTSRWLELLAGAAVLAALLCFLAEQRTGAVLAWWLGIGLVLFALLCVGIEAIDDALERHHRGKQHESQDAVQRGPGEERAAHEQATSRTGARQ